MTVRDRLLHAAWEAGDAAGFVRVGRLAWLVELAVELQLATDVDALLEAAVRTRTADLEEEVWSARRRALRAEAALAAREAA